MVAAGRSYTPHVQYLAKYSFVEAEEGRGCFHSLWCHQQCEGGDNNATNKK